MAKSRIKQRQSQKQTVIVKLDSTVTKRKRRRPRAKKATEGVSITPTSLPPNVIYQSSYSRPYPVYKAPMPQERTPFLQDVGQVGTEGRVEILPQPTKKEQLEDLTQPVPINRAKDIVNQRAEMPSQLSQFSDTEALSRQIAREFAAVQRDIAKFNATMPVTKTSSIPARRRPIPESIPELQTQNILSSKMPEPTLDLYNRYEPVRGSLTESLVGKPKRSDSVISDITIPSEEAISSMAAPQAKSKGKASWDYWLNEYESLTGQRLNRKEAGGNLAKFKEVVTKMKKSL